jgi:hypothetical protein
MYNINDYLSYLNKTEFTKVESDIKWVRALNNNNKSGSRLMFQSTMTNIVINTQSTDARRQLMNVLILAAI